MRPRLEKLRIEKGLTQEDLATKVGVNKSFISRFDTQKSHSYKLQFALKDALELTCIDDLYENEDKDTSS